MGPTVLLPLRRKAFRGFFPPKNPTASAWCEPANLGTKGSTLPLDHRSRFAEALGRVFMQNVLPVIGSFKKIPYPQ